MRQFKPLTSLRAFLALWVLCRHWFYSYGPDGTYFDIGFTSTFFDHGYLGVDGFFILSGFILAYNYGPGGRLDWKKFLVARIARIYPVYVVCLLIFTIAVLARDVALRTDMLGTGGYTASKFLLELFLLSAWRYAGPAGWNDVAWSVSAEWFAYVWFPLFLLCAPRTGKGRILAMMLVSLAAGRGGSNFSRSSLPQWRRCAPRTGVFDGRTAVPFTPGNASLCGLSLWCTAVAGNLRGEVGDRY